MVTGVVTGVRRLELLRVVLEPMVEAMVLVVAELDASSPWAEADGLVRSIGLSERPGDPC